MLLQLERIGYAYRLPTGAETAALSNINIKLAAGETVALVGASGSGKTTLAQLICGLRLPSAGQLIFKGTVIAPKSEGLTRLRKAARMAFQYPEQQLFAETIFDDIAFGPRNLGLNEDEVRERVLRVMAMVGLERNLLNISPFALSGGQQRRAGLAGIFALEPEVLIVDEPTAGLDPGGRETIIKLLGELASQGTTVVLISHDMDEVVRLASRVIVLAGGEIVMDGPIGSMFSSDVQINRWKLERPPITQLMHTLRQRGKPVSSDCLTIEQAERELLRWRKG